MTNDFDPADLVMLAAAYHNPNLEDAELLLSVAKMLHRLWLEIPEGEYAGVWAYDIAYPLGDWLAGNNLHYTVEEAEAFARRLLEEA